MRAVGSFAAFHGQRTKKLSSLSIGVGAGDSCARRDGGCFSGRRSEAGCLGDFFRLCGIGDDCLRAEPDCAAAVLASLCRNPCRVELEPAAPDLVSNAGVEAGITGLSGFSIAAMDHFGAA